MVGQVRVGGVEIAQSGMIVTQCMVEVVEDIVQMIDIPMLVVLSIDPMIHPADPIMVCILFHHF